MKSYQKKYDADRKEARKEYDRNKDVRKILFRDSRKRAKKYHLPHQITIDDIVIPKMCPIFGIELFRGKGRSCDNSPSLDQIVPRTGYTKNNIEIISHKANRLKNTATLDELILMGEWAKKKKTQLESSLPNS